MQTSVGLNSRKDRFSSRTRGAGAFSSKLPAGPQQSPPLFLCRDSPGSGGEGFMDSASASSSLPATTERRGIPAAAFVEDVQTYLAQSGLDVSTALTFLQERYGWFVWSCDFSSLLRDLTGQTQGGVCDFRTSHEGLMAGLFWRKNIIFISVL